MKKKAVDHRDQQGQKEGKQTERKEKTKGAVSGLKIDKNVKSQK